ncbi:hypothetical protein MASR2M78_30730 [Treponema sp.]
MNWNFSLLLLRVEYAGLARIEPFVDAIPWLEKAEKLKLTIVASELFDNIVAHSQNVRWNLVVLGIKRGARLSLCYRSSNLDEFWDAVDSQYLEDKTRPIEARYDVGSNRYRGLGLGMVARLASKVQVHKGLFWHRISVVC